MAEGGTTPDKQLLSLFLTKGGEKINQIGMFLQFSLKVIRNRTITLIGFSITFLINKSKFLLFTIQLLTQVTMTNMLLQDRPIMMTLTTIGTMMMMIGIGDSTFN